MKKKRIILDEPTEKFLSNLKVLRQQRGLTQKQLAQELGLLRSIYQRYEAQNYLPHLSRLMQLADYFDYDLSDSINHKKYYGGLPSVRKITSISGRKAICLDDVADKFLSELKNLREKAGLTQEEAADIIGIDVTTLYAYEHRKRIPFLGMFFRLAQLYNYDISGSVNYKYLYRFKSVKNIRKRMEHYGFTVEEMSELIGYSKCLIRETSQLRKRSSINCLAAMLNVLDKEAKCFSTI